ncbi:hypothetical protein [Myxococcus qinghaiensis]|uniref:hypothetical protein n=1 Tax=Myxococcus qinghaiensis TaxID=2906758 RepID=UPI0020A7680E|nr:hypothetical protein [Myxococcus qinghaiensis]MCP3167805.1 hypothetical protein [Myxococcus qinghaiensis]
MGNQMTEMLKGTLEGIVLAILAVRPEYGYEITAGLREMGCSDIAEAPLALVASTTQGATAICAHLLAPRGELELRTRARWRGCMLAAAVVVACLESRR